MARSVCGRLQRARFEQLEVRRLLAVAINVNFQPSGAALPTGYVADAGSVYADRGNGFTYGWNQDASSAARDRNSSAAPDQRYDTLIHTQAFGSRTWEIAIPNGQYSVRVVGGDPSYTDSTIAWNAEGVLIASGSLSSSNHFVDGTQVVTVSDGRLTLSNASGASNNKICFVQISTPDANGGPEQPYPSLPNVPGDTIEAENYDTGGSNVAYLDNTSGNLGQKYRTDDVDIVAASEGNYAVGYTRPGEWLKYTVNATQTGQFDLSFRVTSGTSGGVFHVEIDGTNASDFTLPATGGWSNWTTTSRIVNINSTGQHVLKLVFDSSKSGGDIGNVGSFTIVPHVIIPSVNTSTPDANASEVGLDTGTIRFTRSFGTTGNANPLTVYYLIKGTATNGVDYDTLSGNVTIPAGSSFADVTITPKQDGVAETNETVQLLLTPSPNQDYAVAGTGGIVNIADADSVNLTGWPTSWTAGPNIPKARWESSSVQMDGKIWAFGGWMSASTVGTQQVDVYDIASGKWSTLPSYAPIPHTHSAPAPDPANHVIYFVGGLFGNYPGVPTNRVWKFNTLNQTWSELPSMPENHSSGGAAVVNGQLHYFGGVLDDRETNTGKHIFLDLNNPAAGWQTAPDMPNPRDHFGTIVVNGMIYAIGGEFGHDKTHNQQKLVDRYDPVAQTWTHLSDMPIAKSHFESATFLWNGKIVVAGGQADNYASTDNVSMYDPSTDSWSVIGKLPQALQGTVVQLAGDKIIVTTGNPGTGPIGNLWIGQLS